MMRDIEAKVHEGRRLSTADAAVLLSDAPLIEMGALAKRGQVPAAPAIRGHLRR